MFSENLSQSSFLFGITALLNIVSLVRCILACILQLDAVNINHSTNCIGFVVPTPEMCPQYDKTKDPQD